MDGVFDFNIAPTNGSSKKQDATIRFAVASRGIQFSIADCVLSYLYSLLYCHKIDLKRDLDIEKLQK